MGPTEADAELVVPLIGLGSHPLQLLLLHPFHYADSSNGPATVTCEVNCCLCVF